VLAASSKSGALGECHGETENGEAEVDKFVAEHQSMRAGIHLRQALRALGAGEQHLHFGRYFEFYRNCISR